MLKVNFLPRISAMARIVAAAGLLVTGACVPVVPVATASQPAESMPTEVEITHYSGTDMAPVNPETVVVADMAALLSLQDLGVEGIAGMLGLAVPVPDQYAAALDNPDFAELGSVWEPDYEAINALEPDLIIVAGRSSRIYPDMKEIAPTVDLTIWEDFYNKFQEQHRNMGMIFGVEDRVEERLAELDALVQDVSARTEGAGKALILMTTGAEVTAYGPGSRFGFVHDTFGYAAADENLEREATHGDAVSFEYILEMQPDVLFVIDRASAIGAEGEAAAKILDNELVAQTPAWQNGRVVYVDSFAWYIAWTSLPAFFQVVEDIEAGLQ
ncbi:MAG: ABC transporter substrate-binding protein [Caldilineaceae bacterium SB0670_bin_27]|uniref:ABC transporter substrate-binding protein n=1 Tax=Caldilineaceae bacterium SB0664_bin_27 TaxID=2605260 RepID=A0A6B0YM96_9CHLR|nr:ABC transporter substrate-binding protein [Caldilineaceae bacterium SB0664_bin_27]MYJ78367.1 ABC transporter substrate-binding protein [Caldilineaceae bacterium SB0670_bin_27]